MLIIITGGTIDSYYDTDSCTAVPFRHSVIAEFLEKTVAMDVSGVAFTELCMKDSREVTDEDRRKICQVIDESPETDFVVTHGTYTMFETARFIMKHTGRRDARITVTGSLIPLVGFAPTDAGFNLAAAMMNSTLASPGVYVAIRGRISKADEAVKLHS